MEPRYIDGDALDQRPTDPKGRVMAHDLSDREALIECVILLRAFGDALEMLSSHPMAGALLGGR
jgi:hypothetical protein